MYKPKESVLHGKASTVPCSHKALAASFSDSVTGRSTHVRNLRIPQKIERTVQHMCPDINQRAASLHSFIGKITPAGNSSSSVPLHVRIINGTKIPRQNLLFQKCSLLTVPEMKPVRQKQLLFFRLFFHGLCLLNSYGRWLFT